MERYLHFILKIPKTAIAVLVALTLFFAYGITTLEFDSSVESLLPQNDPDYQYYNHSKEIFGDSGRFIILLVSHDPLWSQETFQRMDDLIQDLEEYQTYDETRERLRIETIKTFQGHSDIDCKQLMDAFKGDDVFLKTLKRHIGDKFRPDVILSPHDMDGLVEKLEQDLSFKRQELVNQILSPITAKDISGKNDTLTTYDLIEKDRQGHRKLPATESDFALFRQKLLRNPAFENALYAKDPESGAITDFGMLITFVNMTNQDPIARHICKIIESHQQQLHIVVQGMPYSNIVFNDYMRQDLIRFLPIVLCVVTIVFFINFRTLRGVLLPSISLGMSTTWILGLMGYLGIKITAVGISLPPLMVAVGSSYAIHILNQYYLDLQIITRKGVREGLVSAMSHISTTVLLAGLTTFAAFMTLCTNQVSAIREWGIFSAIGVIFSVFIACTLIPTWMSLLPHRSPAIRTAKMPKATPKKNIDSILTAMISGATRHYKAVLIVVCGLLATSVAGILRLNVESDFLQHFKKDAPIRVNAKIIEKKLAGRWGFNILLDSGTPDGVKTPEFLNTVESLRTWLTSDANRNLNVARTDAFSDFIKTMHMAMNNDDPAYYAVPETKEEIMDYLEIYSGEDKDLDGRIDEFESYVDEDFETVSILARLTQREDYTLGTAQIKRIINTVDAHLKQTLPKPYTYRITGFPVMNVKMVDYIISGQLQSLLLSFVFIMVIVTLLFKTIKAAPLALIPMSVAVAISFGIMGWFHINLDIITSIIAAITIGIGIDDTIHVLNTYRRFSQQEDTVEHAIKKTLRVSGKAIIYTSLALIAGFAVLATSSFRPVILFGMLMAVTMTATTLGALLILPAVIQMTQVNLMTSRAKNQGRMANNYKTGGLQ